MIDDANVAMDEVPELLCRVGHGAYEWTADVNCDGEINWRNRND